VSTRTQAATRTPPPSNASARRLASCEAKIQSRIKTCPACEQRLAALEAAVAALQAGNRGEVDEDDAALLTRIVELLGRPFVASDVLGLRADEAVAQLLDDIGIADAAGAGCWLRRLRDQEVSGLRVVRGRRGPGGHLWRVIAVESM